MRLRAFALFTPDAQGKDLPAGPDRLGRRFQRLGVDICEGLFKVADRPLDYIGIKPAQIVRFADVLQPTRPVRKADSPLADRLAERRAEILVALEPHLAGHAHEGVGFDVGCFGNLAHGGNPHVIGVFQHVTRGFLRFGRQRVPLFGQAL